jgi:O-antigen/teichoic acid export membrane protein
VSFLGTTALGLYGIAYRFGELTWAAIAQPITQVTFPAFARMRARREEWRGAFRAVLRLVALLTFPIGAVVSGAAEPIVDTLLGDKWTASIGPLAVFGIWAIVKPLEGTLGWLLNSLEYQSRLAALRGIALIPFVPALLIAADRGGLTTVAWVMVAHIVALTVAVSLTVRARAGIPLKDQLGAVLPLAAGAAAAWAASRGVSVALDGAAPLAALLAAGASGLAAYMGAASALEPALFPRALQQARRTLQRQPA